MMLSQLHIEDPAVTTDLDIPLYLKQGVIIEPLFCRWWAWPHLLAPAQAALNIAFRYMPLLQSFVSRPSLHISAAKDPRMFGGPFVDLGMSDVPRVRELLSDTQQRLARLLALASDLRKLDLLIQSNAHGASFNSMYSLVPASLSGMIELMYDLHNHPRVHLIEELLYGEYGDDLRKGGQQISLSISDDRRREFFMSTPRLESVGALTMTVAYSDPIVDTLSMLKREAASLRELAATSPGLERLGRYPHLLTTDVPPSGQRHLSQDIRVRYFGHACVLVQTNKTCILIDPTLAPDPGGPGHSSCKRFTVIDLPDVIDYVVLSHSHQDHFCPETLLQIRSRVRTVVIPANNRGSVVDPSMKLSLRELGFHDVKSLSHFEEIPLDEGRVVSVPFPGEHADLEVYSKQSIFVELKGRRLLFLVDSDGRDVGLYQKVAQRVLGHSTKKIDALFLGMECNGAPLSWLYGPLFSEPISNSHNESRRLSGSNCEHGLQIIRQFSCERVYVYAMGQEPWLRYLMGLEYEPDSVQLTESSRLVSQCRAQGMISERLYGGQDILV